jgi:hypothetical protein
MFSVDIGARDELLKMHGLYELQEPVVVFGMAAKMMDHDGSLGKAFTSGDNESFLKSFKRQHQDNLVFSFAVTLQERSDLASEDVVAIDEFYFQMPIVIRSIVDSCCLCFDDNGFCLRDSEGKIVDLPIA